MTDRPPQAPWPYLRAKEVSQRLGGVDVALLAGLACGRLPALRTVKAFGKSGAVVWLYNRDDVDALALKMGAGARR